MASSFHDLREMMFSLYRDADYRGALDVVLRWESRFPERACDLLFWQMCLRSRVGETSEALAAFQRSLDLGHFYSHSVLADADLDSVRHLRAFERMADVSLEKAAAAGEEVEPPLQIDPPEGIERRGRVVFLHGHGANRDDHVPFWSPVAAAGWSVSLLRGDVPHSTNRYGWSYGLGPMRAAGDIATLTAVASTLPLVVAGFSQGAGLACHLAQSGVVEPLGLVLLAPSFNTFGTPLHVAGGPRSPLWVSVGTEDHHHSDVLGFARHCTDIEVPCFVHQHGGGHDYPSDLADLFAAATDWFGEVES